MRPDRKGPTEDRRKAPRKQIILGGEIVFNGGASRLDCLIREVSEQGCRLVMSNTAGVPAWFTLRIKQDGRRFPARVTWCDDKSVGVEFDEANDDFGPAALDRRRLSMATNPSSSPDNRRFSKAV